MGKYFFVSTAIDYPSSKPHAGHMYEKVCSDIIARWFRLKNKEVHFSTGLDCHGSKIARYAKQANKTPEQYIKQFEKYFLQLCQQYNISYDDFIKTTEDRHKNLVSKMIIDIYKNGDIYKGRYSGYYCSDCESYFSKAELINGLNCPTHNKPTEYLEEQAYFFKMSKYKDKLYKYIKKNPDYIRPEEARNEILKRLEQPLHDFCLTREKIDWGIKFPLDNRFIVAIWIEALINYLTTLNYPSKKYKNFWPGLHIIGKDIKWHHAILWGSWLLASNISLPRIYVHGFVRSSSGEKMSKSLGNVIDPLELSKKYPIDSIRYFLIREINFGQDGDFSEDSLKSRLNNELANDLGNLVNRILTLAEKNFKSGINKSKIDDKLAKKLDIGKIDSLMENLQLNEALNEIWKFIKECNKHINEERPWEMDNKKLEMHLYTLLESLRIISILLYPFIPDTSNKIVIQLSTEITSLKDCKFGKITNYKIKKGPILFNKIQ